MVPALVGPIRCNAAIIAFTCGEAKISPLTAAVNNPSPTNPPWAGS